MAKLAKQSLVVFFLSICFSTIASAHDLFSPEWRGDEGSTYQHWTFDCSANPAAPTTMVNDYGDATAEITLGELNTGWHESLPAMGTACGYWDIGGEGGSIVLDIDNRPLELPYKEIWVQVTYWLDLNAAPTVEIPGASFVSGQTDTVEQVATGGAWLCDLSVWRIEPNPTHEQIIIGSLPQFGAVIDQVVVDTICIPEPVSLVLLGLGGLALMGRRRQNS